MVVSFVWLWSKMHGFLLFLQPDQSFCWRGGDYMLERVWRASLWTAIVCMQARMLWKALWRGLSWIFLWILSQTLTAFWAKSSGVLTWKLRLSLSSSFKVGTFLGRTRLDLTCWNVDVFNYSTIIGFYLSRQYKTNGLFSGAKGLNANLP